MNVTDSNFDSSSDPQPDRPAPDSSSEAPVPADPAAPAGPTSAPELYRWPAPTDPLASMEPSGYGFAPPPPRPRYIPNLGHTVVFFLLLLPALIGSYIVSFALFFAFIRPRTLHSVMEHVQHEVRYAIAIQAIWYIVLWALAALVFWLWWQRPLLQGLHWNGAAARRWFFRFALTGVVLGLVITFAGNFLPMPKAPPILEDLTKSQLGAWMLMLFGISLAPLTEELAFRGFLLPSLVNFFHWLHERGSISEASVTNVGIPLSIVLTSIPFALMHAQQVSFSWGPVLLIGVVSVVLCVIRLRNDSVACGVVVHACYNLTLFTGLLIQTDGFRHLNKLAG